jgi:hypothetical protein
MSELWRNKVMVQKYSVKLGNNDTIVGKVSQRWHLLRL